MCITFLSFPGIFHCSDEKQVTDIIGQSYEVDGNSMHNDGADDNPLSWEHTFGRHRVSYCIFCRWVMKDTLFLRSIQLVVPGVSCTLVNIEGFNMPAGVNKVTQLAHFLRKTLCLGACALCQLIKQVCTCLTWFLCDWFVTDCVCQTIILMKILCVFSVTQKSMTYFQGWLPTCSWYCNVWFKVRLYQQDGWRSIVWFFCL